MSQWYNRKPRLGAPKQQLDDRRRNEADVRPKIIMQPGPGFGLYTVHDTFTGDESIVSAGATSRSLAPNETVMVGSHSGSGGEVILSAAPVGRLGTAQFSFPSPVGLRLDTVGITSADPNTLPQGTVAEVVTFTGFGFNEDPVDVFRPVVYNPITKVWDDDPLITLGAVTWTSATEVDIPVSVSATAPVGYEIKLEVTRA